MSIVILMIGQWRINENTVKYVKKTFTKVS